MNKPWMIYGAYGYTGRLMVEQALDRGLKPLVAGRNQAKTEAIAAQYGLEYKTFSLQQAADVKQAIAGMHLVLHCAGPFSATAEPMMKACLKADAHYLDITGEIDVFALGHSYDKKARRKDVVIIPGVGFDVVPTDCLSARLAEKLPSATSLELAFQALGGPSPGTAKTSVEGLAKGCRVRQGGEMVTVPLAWKDKVIPFPSGDRNAATIPWGDVYTAHISTGIPDIAVYLAMPPKTIQRLRRMRKIQPVLGWNWVQNWMKRRIDRQVAGPSDSRRQQTGSEIWAEVTSADGRRAAAVMTTPNGYDLTVSAGLGITEYLLENAVEGGYYTPSLLMGAGYAESLPGVELKFIS